MKNNYLKRSLALLLTLVTPLAFSQKVIQKKQNTKPISVEQKSVADNIILDDLIITGSACIGFDCVNGESFGFSTIRLKENNLRIDFNDTSTSASFPSTDWEIEANESANGGLNAFSIHDLSAGSVPFRIEANAPNSSLYVDDGGRIGVGTANPVVGVHHVNGNTPTVRLDQDGSSGFTPQVWDMAGNETNFFIRDATNGSSLPFRIRPGASSNALYIDSDNDIGLGTASPTQPLHIKRANPNILLDGANDWLFNVNADTLRIQLDGNTKLAINSTNVYVKDAILPGASIPSDRRLKSNINTFSNAQRTIDLLSPKTFTYDLKAFPDYGFPKGTQYGLIAQEIEKVLPDYVTEFSFPDGKRFKTVNYIGLIPILLQSNKEQQAEIEQLKVKISQYETIESRLTALEAKLEEKEVGVNVPLKTEEK
jgi:hypothetical protein